MRPLVRDWTAQDLTVIIPSRGRSEILCRTLTALENQTEPGFETVVVLDGIDQEIAPSDAARVLRQEHAGPGVARNRGVSVSNRPLILFLGDDMIPRPNVVGRHLAAHRAEPAPEAAFLGRIVWHPSVPDDRLHRWLDWSGALFDYPTLEREATREAGWTRFYSSHVSLKRELFARCGGFDPDFVFDYEDLDLAWRLHGRGMRLLYESGAVAEHLHPYDWESVRRRYASRAGAERLMTAKHDWFEPWFHRQIQTAERERRAARLWTVAAERAPRRPGRVRGLCRRRANQYYLQRLAPSFLAAWETSETGAGRRQSGKPGS